MKLKEYTVFLKKISKLSLPIVLQNVISFLFSFSDSFMISGLGANAVSGIFLANQVTVLLTMFLLGVESAISAISTQHWGEKDTKSIKRIGNFGLWFSLSVALLLMLFCRFYPENILSLFSKSEKIIIIGAKYLKTNSLSFPFFAVSSAMIAIQRSVENTKLGLFASAFALFTNMVLNYAFIDGNFGAKRLGYVGAAYATVAARAVEIITVLLYVFLIDKKLKIKICDFLKFDKKLTLLFLRYGLPLVLGQLIWASNTLYASAVISRLDTPGIAAAFCIANSVNTLSHSLANGMSSAVGIIIGKSIGEDEIDRVKEYAKKTELIFLFIGMLTSFILILLKNPFIRIYKATPETESIASKLITVFILLAPFTVYQSVCLSGIIKGAVNSSFIFKTETLFILLAILPASIFATRLGASPEFILLSLKIDQLLKCPFSYFKIRKYDWINRIKQ